MKVARLARLDLTKLRAAQARLGEAVADPGQWIALMEDICAATGTLGSALLRSEDRTADVPITPSVLESFKVYFANNLHVGDVRAAKGLPLITAGQAVVRDQDLFSSESEMIRDPLYANLTRFRMRWFAAVSFRSGPAIWVMSLQRALREGMFEDQEIKALESLSQPLSDVATLSRLVGQQVLQGSLNAFELIEAPALAMTANGMVLNATTLATRLFDDEFRVRLNRLHLRDTKASLELDRLLYRYPQENELRPRSKGGIENLVVVRRQSRKPILIKMLPVYGAARSPFLGARFILILRDMDASRQPPLEVIAEIFSLSPAEAKVASMIASGSSPEQIADELVLSRETVRNQIKAVFGKTGVHRQNELAALMARILL
jgi:DNA-binding CsgD family transcriptional regulator